jgi:hypothetical protein
MPVDPAELLLNVPLAVFVIDVLRCVTIIRFVGSDPGQSRSSFGGGALRDARPSNRSKEPIGASSSTRFRLGRSVPLLAAPCFSS